MKQLKSVMTVLLAVVLAAALAGCGGGSADYADGTYEGQSRVYEGDEDGYGDGYGVVTITIQDNVITACGFYIYETDGTLKDEDYGKQGGEITNVDFYNKAQRAVLAAQRYAEQLVETGSANEVDAITGATISYDEFQEALDNALKSARQ